MASQCSSWSDLPTEILELIFDCSKDPIDILRCGATCKAWRPTASEVYPKFLPLCLIDTDVVFNILTKQTRKIRLPDEAEGRRICCSNNSWLLTVDDTDFHSKMHLLNIFTRARIFLPPVMSLYGCEMIKHRQLELVNWKLLLLHSPLSSDCKVVLFHSINTTSGRCCKLSLCEPGNILWTNRGTATNPFCWNMVDETYLRSNNRTCFWILISDSNLIRMHLQKDVVVKDRVPKPWPENYTRTFLVKSEEDNFFVGCRCTSSDQALNGKLFIIFEFGVSTAELKEVNDLGGYALFLSTNAKHLLVKTNGRSKASFKANCIYFFRGHDYEEFGIYDLKTKDIEYVPCQSITKHANWINLDV